MVQSYENNTPLRVAIADDHHLLRESLIPKIEEDGNIEVIISAANGKELVQAITKSELLPHVAIIDIMMPKMDGFETVKYLKKKWPNIKVLVLTSYLYEEYVIKMIIVGANGYLSKNSHSRTLREAIQRVHEYDIYCNELFCEKDVKAVQEGKKVLPPKLSESEAKLLRFCVADMTYSEIADKMGITQKSVEGQRSRLFEKTGAKTRTGLAMYAIRYGYVLVEEGVKMK